MNIYRKNLKRLGICLIVVSLIDVLLNLVAWRFLIRTHHTEIEKMTLELIGASIKDVLCMISGILGYWLYRSQSQRVRRFIRAEWVLIAVSVLCILFFARGGLDRILDIPLIMALMLVYTMNQLRNRQQLWTRITLKKPAVLELKLNDPGEWFDPMVMGPHLTLGSHVDSAVHRFLVTEKTQSPLEINIYGMELVSEALRGTMREVFQEHYADEEQRVEYYLEGRYSRALGLIIVSLIALVIWVRVSGVTGNDDNTVMTILSNFAGFSLWQIGNTYFERSQGYEELARVMIARHAQIHFI